MFSLQSKLDKAAGVFGKARAQYEAVVIACEAAMNNADSVIAVAETDKDEATAVRNQASRAVSNINEIIGA